MFGSKIGVLAAGTPEYLAPERWQDPNVASQAADVYSLGATLFEMLKGHCAYGSLPHRPTDRQVLELRKRHDTGIISGLDGKPKSISAIVRKCMAPSPEDRFQTIEELRGALNDVYRRASKRDFESFDGEWEKLAALAPSKDLHADFWGEDESALQEWNDLLAINPRDHAALTNKALVLMQLRRFDEALATALLAVEADPLNIASQVSLGNAFDEVGEGPKAVSCYLKAVQLAPRSPLAHYNLALALEHLGNTSDAIREYELTVEIDDTYAQAWTNLGILVRKTAVHAALRHFEKAVALVPTLEPALYQLAFTLWKFPGVSGRAREVELIRFPTEIRARSAHDR